MPLPAIPEDVKQRIDRWADAWLDATFARTLQQHAQRPGLALVPTAVFSEWRGRHFYLNVRYRAFLGSSVEETVVRQTRMTPTGFGRFDLAYFRHTERWWTTHRELTAEQCFREIESNELFWPVA